MKIALQLSLTVSFSVCIATYLLSLEHSVELGSKHNVTLDLELAAHEGLLAIDLAISEVGEGLIGQVDNAVGLALGLALIDGHVLLQVDGLDKLFAALVLDVELKDSVGLLLQVLLVGIREAVNAIGNLLKVLGRLELAHGSW